MFVAIFIYCWVCGWLYFDIWVFHLCTQFAKSHNRQPEISLFSKIRVCAHHLHTHTYSCVDTHIQTEINKQVWGWVLIICWLYKDYLLVQSKCVITKEVHIVRIQKIRKLRKPCYILFLGCEEKTFYIFSYYAYIYRCRNDYSVK